MEPGAPTLLAPEPMPTMEPKPWVYSRLSWRTHPRTTARYLKNITTDDKSPAQSTYGTFGSVQGEDIAFFYLTDVDAPPSA